MNLDGVICGVYEIRNKVNGRRYVGSTVHIRRRWNKHKSRLKRGVHSNLHLQRSWDKYGAKNFVFTLLVITERWEMRRIENGLIPNAEYNIAKDATKSWLGRRHTEKTRRLMSEVATGENNQQYGKHHTLQHRLNQSKALLGEKHPSWIELPVKEMNVLRSQGYSYTKIGEIYGVSHATARSRILGLSSSKFNDWSK